MKIGIIGAGAMGCLYACMLCEKNDVTLLDVDSETVDVVNKDGVFMREANSEKEDIFKPKAALSGGFDGKFDLIIVFVKDTATAAALKSNRSLIGEHTVLLSLQNGMGNYEIMEEFADTKQILLGTTKHNCVTLGRGKIYHSGAGVTHIGSPADNGIAVKKIYEVFNNSGIETEICEDVKRLLWEKLFINMTINSITALLDCHINVIADDKNASAVAGELIKEAVAVAKCDGEEFDYDTVYNDVITTAEKLGTGKASMCQDIENGRKTEIDFINGAVIRLGKRHGIATPYHSMITSLIHAMENL